MTAIRWSILIVSFLFPVATDLLFLAVSVLWLVGCTIIAFFFDFFCGWNLLDIGVCLIPGILLWFLSRISNGIGIGDVLCMFLIGAISGMRIGLEILFGGSVLCFFGQLICMAVRAVARKKEQKEERRICVAEGKAEIIPIQGEMPFVPWLLVSIFINWVFQEIFI